MSNNTLKNLAKLVGVGALIYGAYKLGQKSGRGDFDYLDENKNSKEPEILINSSEEDEIVNLIKELKSKPYKTKKDFNNIDLLEVKLKQLRKK